MYGISVMHWEVYQLYWPMLLHFIFLVSLRGMTSSIIILVNIRAFTWARLSERLCVWGVCACAVSYIWLSCNPMDCSTPSSSAHGISQAKILEWVAISYSRGIFPTHGLNSCLFHLLHWQADSLPLHHLESPKWKITQPISEWDSEPPDLILKLISHPTGLPGP